MSFPPKPFRQVLALFLGFLTAVLCLVPTVRAQSPIGREFQVPEDTIRTQNEPDIASNSQGGLIVVWKDFEDVLSESDQIYGRSYSSLGEPGGELQLADTRDIPLTPIDTPLVVPQEQGDFTLFYSRARPEGGDTFWLQRFSSTGEPAGGRVPISAINSGHAFGSAVAKLPFGRFFTVTTDEDCPPLVNPPPGVCAFSRGVFARVLGSNGQPVSPYFRVNRDPKGGQTGGKRNLSVDGGGNVVVVWSSEPNQHPELTDVWAQRFKASGERLGDEFLVNTTTRGSQTSPSVAADPSGPFIVVWESRKEEEGPQQILTQRFSKAGKRIGPEFRVNSDTREKNFGPSVATDRFGNFVVVWWSFSLSSPVPTCTDVKGRLYREDGTPVGPDFFLSADPRPCEEAPQVAFGPNGIFAAAWDRFNGADDDVYAARFSASPGDEPCLVRGGRVLCDTGRTGGKPELELSFGGRPGEVTLMGDFDGDGRDDICARFGTRFRCDLDHRGNPSEGQIVSFGLASDTPLLGDLNGDGKAEPCVRRGDQFLCDTKRDGGAAEVVIRFGKATDIPLLGDLDGDGRDDPCVFRNGTFLCDLDHRGGAAEAVISFGAAGDQPALGDLNGDGRDDPCVLSGGHLRCDTAHNGGAAEVDLALSVEPGDRLLIGNLDGL